AHRHARQAHGWLLERHLEDEQWSEAVAARPGENAVASAVARRGAERVRLWLRSSKRILCKLGVGVLRHESVGDSERCTAGRSVQQLGRQQSVHAWNISRQQGEQGDLKLRLLERLALVSEEAA